MLPGCHYGALQSPWKLHKHSIFEETSTMKLITHSIFFFSFKSSMEGFSWPGETASTLPPKDSPSVNEDYQYAPLGFASPPVVFQVVWSVCAFVACEAT